VFVIAYTLQKLIYTLQKPGQVNFLWSNNDVRTVTELIPQWVLKFYNKFLATPLAPKWTSVSVWYALRGSHCIWRTAIRQSQSPAVDLNSDLWSQLPTSSSLLELSSQSVASTLPELLPGTVSQTTFIVSLLPVSSNAASKLNFSRQRVSEWAVF